MRVWLVRVIVAALVLAAGVALGTGPLQHSGRERDRQLAAQKREVARAQDRIEALTASGRYAEDFAGATAEDLVAGKLAGRTVALIRLPGSETETVDALRDLITAAGAEVSAEAALGAGLAGTDSRQLVEALTSQMVAQDRSLDVPESAVGYERFGILLARALAADKGAGPKGSTYDQTAIAIVSGLQAADLVTVTKSLPRASLTVFVAGPAAEDARAAAGNAVPVTIVAAYATRTPTVLAGPYDAAGPFGVIGELRSQGSVAATVPGVDSVDTPMGRVAVVLALAARVTGGVGQYGGGAGATGGPVPGA